jgi:hypothetical protein
MRIFALCFLCVTKLVAHAESPCARTPTAAIQAYAQRVITETATGYRVVRLRTDAALNITWADLKHCDHPEWPGLSLATHAIATRPNDKSVTRQIAIAIHPGETVRVWRDEPNAHLEMAAISDQGGAVGDRIRLHVATPNGEPVHIYFGHVRGPGNVEIEQ